MGQIGNIKCGHSEQKKQIFNDILYGSDDSIKINGKNAARQLSPVA